MKEKKINVLRALWQFCRSLLSVEDITHEEYVQQLEYLMFLKMAVEYKESLKNLRPLVPSGFDWDSLLSKKGEELVAHYQRILETLKKEPGLVGELFKTATNKIKDPKRLKDLIEIVDKGTWTKMD